MRLRPSSLFFFGALALSVRASAQTPTEAPSEVEAAPSAESADSSDTRDAQAGDAAPHHEPSFEEPPATRAAPVSRVLVLHDGRRIEGVLLEQVAGAYVIVLVDGRPEAVDWERVATIDGMPRPPVPPAGEGSLIPPDFTPGNVKSLAEDGRKASETVAGLFAPKDGKTFIESIQSSQGLLETVGLKRGPPSGAAVGFAMAALPLCFFLNYGNLNGPHANYLGPYCSSSR